MPKEISQSMYLIFFLIQYYSSFPKCVLCIDLRTLHALPANFPFLAMQDDLGGRMGNQGRDRV